MGCKVEFENKSCLIKKSGGVIADGFLHDSHYYLRIHSNPSFLSHHTAHTADINCWHERLAHLNVDAITQMLWKRAVLRMNVGLSKLVESCDPCLVEKVLEHHFQEHLIFADKTFWSLCIMMCDPCLNSSGGSKYFVTFIDDISRYCRVNKMNNESKVFHKFQ